MNKVILIGNLVRDPEISATSNGVAFARFTLAVNRRYENAGGEKEADFINVIAWRELAELCSKYLAKGKKVSIIGALQTRTYTPADGITRYITEVIASEIEFLTPQNKAAVPPPEPPPAGKSKSDEYDLTLLDNPPPLPF